MVKRGGKMAILSKKKKTKKQKIKKVVNKAEHTQIDFEKQHQNALEQSVVLVGPSDVGKSVLGRHFAKKYGLVYIDMQEILRCRKSIDRIQADIDFYKVCSRQTKKECRNSLARRYAAYTRIERQNLEFRLNFPNVSNLEDLNYKNGELSYQLKKINGFDDICSAVYMKKYENIILKQIVEQMQVPCVLDTTTELPVNLNREYAKRFPIILNEYNNFKDTTYKSLKDYLTANNLTIEEALCPPTESFEDVYNTIHQIKNVVGLEYPIDHKIHYTPLQNALINSGHYEKMASNKTITADFIACDAEGFSVLKKQQLTECMDIMASFVYDYNPEIYSNAKEIEIAF